MMILLITSNQCFLLLIYMRENQKIIHDVYFDKTGFGSKSRIVAEAGEKDKTVTMGDINESFRKNVEQKESQSIKTVLSPLLPQMSIKWICCLLTIWMNKSLG